ncbi:MULTISPECIES: DUF4190 domain-containing protein [Pseudomonas]|uniref:DUF4190 domain-containing protein n=2 Tax=Pseudomonas TaxID=286 RepID=A0ABN5TA00_9PSED|nr:MULTISPECIES: DUF4190 domain-containing protein [Pseudomonas]AZL66370.1 DUF4190 domain-containing protein [Pseudomonas oryziphila]AZL71720.1 DUF4190 domain-containing protein [Pseudomonas oryziphila]UVK83294.1 DUF4190 domain-containing protein [Pseudomonas sichuanensis]
MAMVYCRGCAKQLHETAPTCPQCGAPQHANSSTRLVSGETPWMGIVSLMLGIMCVLALFDDSEWDVETIMGFVLIASTSLLVGSISINQKRPGNGMAIAGVVMAGISLICGIGQI